MTGLYKTARVALKTSRAALHATDSESFWRQIADQHGVWLPNVSRIKDVPLDRLDAIAKTLIRKAERAALIQGVGFSFGGAATILPDASFLGALIVRLTQRLCLLYGMDADNEGQRVEMWKVAAAAAGLDLTKDFAEKHVLKKFAPHLAERLAPRMGAEVAGKWATRLVPVAGSAIGGAVNFSFVRTWGRRLQRDLRARYLAMQSDSVAPALVYPATQPITS